jgi:hypothetical protein
MAEFDLSLLNVMTGENLVWCWLDLLQSVACLLDSSEVIPMEGLGALRQPLSCKLYVAVLRSSSFEASRITEMYLVYSVLPG